MKSTQFASRTCRLALGRRTQPVVARRCFATNAQPIAEATDGALSPRWLSDFQARLKKLPVEKLPPAVKFAADGLQMEIDKKWLDLMAGSEGFLTTPRWRGLNSHAVAWGDMVGFLSARFIGHV